MDWACVQTYGGAERKAVENLTRQGYEAFCPMYVKILDGREFPLFPCYAFVSLGQQQAWGPVNNTYGVIRLLTNRSIENPKPLFVHADVVAGFEALRNMEDGYLRPHVRVRIKKRSSPFYDMIGTVVSLVNHQRIQVLMSLFSRDVLVEFDNQRELELV